MLFFLLLPIPALGKLRILATTSDLASIAQMVGGDHVQVLAIAKGRQDPHFIDAKPSIMLEAHRAVLFIRVGLSLEIAWEPAVLEGARNGKIQPGNPGHLDASEGVRALEIPGVDLDRSMGDVHPYGNPHIWLDPWNGRIIARNIAVRLSEIDPEHSGDYRGHLATFLKKLDGKMFGVSLVKELGGEELWRHELAGDLADWLQAREKRLDPGSWAGRMATHRGQEILTFHKSFPYFAHRFGLVVATELEAKPGIPPSPVQLMKVIRLMRQRKVRVLLMEPFYDRKPADLVARKTGALVVQVANSTGGQEGVDDYLSLIDNLVQRVADALDGKES